MSGWLVTGASGQLGRSLLRVGCERGLAIVGLDREALDVTDPEAVRQALARLDPEVVVNCAAYTHVDRCEEDEEAGAHVNAEGPAHLSRVCRERGALLVQIRVIRRLFADVEGFTLASLLDYYEGFNSCHIREKDRHIITFTWKGSKYQMISPGYGIKIMPGRFQRMNMDILKNHLSSETIFHRH